MGNIIKSLPSEITKFFGGEGSGTSSTLEAIVIGLLTKALNLPSIPTASAEHPPGTTPPPPPPSAFEPTGPKIITDEFVGPLQPGTTRPGDLPPGIYDGQNIDTRKPPPNLFANQTVNDLVDNAFASTRTPTNLSTSKRRKTQSSGIQLGKYYGKITLLVKQVKQYEKLVRTWRSSTGGTAKAIRIKQLALIVKNLTQQYQTITNHLYLYSL